MNCTAVVGIGDLDHDLSVACKVTVWIFGHVFFSTIKFVCSFFYITGHAGSGGACVAPCTPKVGMITPRYARASKSSSKRSWRYHGMFAPNVPFLLHELVIALL